MVRVNNLQVEALYDTDASISVISKCFFDKLLHKPKLMGCNRRISGAGGEALVPVGECFIQLQISKRTFQDRIICTGQTGLVQATKVQVSITSLLIEKW